VREPSTGSDATELEQQVRAVIDRLTEEFAGKVPPDMVEHCTRDALAPLEDARVTTYLPVFVYRHARERIRALLESPPPPA
jgi:hypothetical protein